MLEFFENPLFLMAACFWVAAIVGFASVALVRPLFLKLNFVDMPGHRKIHQKPIVLGGGMAIGLAAMIVIPGFIYLQGNSGVIESSAHWMAIAIGAVIVWVVGLIDDANKEVESAALKAIPQIVAAFCVVVGAGVSIPITGVEFIDSAIAIGWIFVITNGMNLLDNMDGLSAGSSMISALTLCFFAMLYGMPIAALALIGFAGVVLGFIPWNFSADRKCFQGDGGAYLCGFVLSSFALVVGQRISGFTGLTAGLVVFAFSLPLMDTSFVFLMRTLAKKPFWIGGTDHLSHRLTRCGLSRTQSVLVLLGLSVLCSGVATMGFVSGISSLSVLVGLVAICIAIPSLVKLFEKANVSVSSCEAMDKISSKTSPDSSHDALPTTEGAVRHEQLVASPRLMEAERDRDTA